MIIVTQCGTKSFTVCQAKIHGFYIPYSAKRWRRKTMANQRNITLAKKTLANNLLWRSSRNEWCMAVGKCWRRKTLANRTSIRQIRQCFPPPTFRAIRYNTKYGGQTLIEISYVLPEIIG